MLPTLIPRIHMKSTTKLDLKNHSNPYIDHIFQGGRKEMKAFGVQSFRIFFGFEIKENINI